MFERNLKLIASQLKEGKAKVRGVPGGSKAILLKELLNLIYPAVVIVPTEQLGEGLTEDLKRVGLKALYLPGWDTPPLDISSPLSILQYRRLRALLKLIEENVQCVVATPQAFLQRVIAPEKLIEISITLKRGKESENISERLTELGYRRVENEPERGEFSLKGSYLEVVTPEDERIEAELFGDEVESLRVNGEEVEEFTLAPLLELPPTKEVLKKLSEIDEELSERHALLGELSGAEKFLPEVLETVPLSEYIGEFKTVFVEPDQIRTSADSFIRQVKENYELLKREGIGSSRPEEFIEEELPSPQLLIYEKPVKDALDLAISPLPPLSEENLKEVAKALQGKRVTLIYTTETFREEAEKLFRLLGVDFSSERGKSSGGFRFDEKKIAWAVEGDVEIPVAKQKREDVTAFEPGTLVVHRDYGIGIFQGIVSRDIGGKTYDFIEIEYAGGEKLYAPFTQIDRIYRYSGYRGKNPKLDRLGGTSWKNLERKIRASLVKFARELAELYRERKQAKKEKILGDHQLLSAFERRFPYRLTPDQQRAIREVYRDMESEKPMDRLICGDVGFGKTEVAMRAAMKAVSAGKQVALIAPTTVLADQHYRTFKKRFSGFPVKIELLSRFKTKKEQKEIIEKLKNGEIDIVIGTHRLTQDDVEFKELGLLIIDEEHRFGVKTKEKLTKLKSNIDVLYLSATPIPRTLYSALSGFRDISLIETPPAGRRGTKVVVGKYSDSILKAAVERELSRGGQVFIVHNDIGELPHIKEKIKNFFPKVNVETVHGQMKPSQIEKIMHSFFEGKVQILVATSIVESGLDVPSANTLIVIGAERFGLSQLYQLKGRVGRGVEKGYCYLLTTPGVKLSPEAAKRLEAMKKLSPLGGGFQLALKDLEIRGAGTLLGPKQSGFVESIGLDLYMKLFEEVIKEREEEDVKLNLPYEAFIPEDFIEDPKEKVKLYSEIASSENPQELMEKIKEIRGYLPDPIVNMFKVMRIKKLSKEMGIKEISVSPSGRAIISFGDEVSISPEKLVEFVKRENGIFTPDRKLYLDVKDLDDLVSILEELKERKDEKSSNTNTDTASNRTNC